VLNECKKNYSVKYNFQSQIVMFFLDKLDIFNIR